MNRACYFLALWLASLVVQTQVAGQTQCQSNADYCRFGIGVDDICPFVDGYTEVGQEESNQANAQAETEPALDLRGRAVVTVLDVDADYGYDCGYDYYYGLHYSGTRSHMPAQTWADPCPADTTAATSVEVVPETVSAPQTGLVPEATPVSDTALGPEASIAADQSGDTADEAGPIKERDYEQECHQAYLEHVAREAEALAAQAPAPMASPYGGATWDAYGYGYSYAYEYDYAHRYHSCPQMIDPAVTEAPSNELADAVIILKWVARGRDFVASLWESELTDSLQTTVDTWKARAAVVLTKLELERLYQEAGHALAAAVHQALVAGHDWHESNVFVFVFDSDLNAEPMAAREAPALGAAEPPADATLPQDEQAADTATSGDDASPQVGALTREQLEPWVRQVVAAGTEAWERVRVAMRRLAQHSLALLASDDLGSPTHR
jgi:hypothetical protein